MDSDLTCMGCGSSSTDHRILVLWPISVYFKLASLIAIFYQSLIFCFA